MNKAADAFRTISEVASVLDVPKHVLRFWEARFPQIKPMKRGGGRRYYRPEDLELLRGIRKLLHGDGYTIKGVQRILREQGVDFVKTEGRTEAAGNKCRAGSDTGAGKGPKKQGKPAPAHTKTSSATGKPASPSKPAAPVKIEALIGELEACRALLTTGIAIPRKATKPGQRRQRAG